MKLKVSESGRTLTVIKEPGDPRFKRGGYADAESTFLYHVKKALQAAGLDVLKKRMWRDGHMVDDRQQYIRSRSLSDVPAFCIHNPIWQTCDAGERFNERGEFDLEVTINPADGYGTNSAHIDRHHVAKLREILEAAQ